jgi:hypothetical protein
MRLVDIDKLKEEIENGEGKPWVGDSMDDVFWIEECMDKAPTAYDIDKVCQKLSEAKDMDELIDYDHAVKIIKNSVKDD